MSAERVANAREHRKPRRSCLCLREKMGVGSPKSHRNVPVPKNSRGGLEESPCKSMEQAENHDISPKRPHAGRGPETKWEISVKNSVGMRPRPILVDKSSRF